MAKQGEHGIGWTDETWNPIRGCSRVSEGCRNCYAERVAARFSGPDMPYEGLAYIKRGVNSRSSNGPHWTGEVRFIEERLADPLKWRKPKRVFVNSMSDLFHEKVQDEWIDRIFAVMALCPQHTFQVLTKRPERMRDYMLHFRDTDGTLHDVRDAFIEGEAQNIYARIHPDEKDTVSQWLAVHLPLPNVWLGVSAEDQPTFDGRVAFLRETPAAVRFASIEPMIAAIKLYDLDDGALRGPAVKVSGGVTLSTPHESPEGYDDSQLCLDWVICGGESGPGARPFNIQWAREVIAQCKAAGVACFVKQLGARPEQGLENAPLRMMSLGLKDRKGADWNEWPEDLRVREYPETGKAR